MKLRKPAQNEMNKELGNKPDELENILEQIETKIKKIKEMVIHEIQKTPRKQEKHRRTLKRSK
jgi:ActR/RegA family two-component response regulator